VSAKTRASASFHAATESAAVDLAAEAFDAFFDEGKWQFVSADSRPLVVDGAGRIQMWEVEFEAESK